MFVLSTVVRNSNTPAFRQNAAIAPLDVAIAEGFTHLIPFAAAHEIIRQGRRDLTLVRMTPDVVYEQRGDRR